MSGNTWYRRDRRRQLWTRLAAALLHALAVTGAALSGCGYLATDLAPSRGDTRSQDAERGRGIPLQRGPNCLLGHEGGRIPPKDSPGRSLRRKR